MKRYFSLGIFLFFSNIYTMGPPSPPPPVVNPRTEHAGVAMPGRETLDGTPTIAIAPRAATERRVAPAVAPRPGRVVNPPTGHARVAMPGRGTLDGTPTNPIVQFARQQQANARAIAAGGGSGAAPAAPAAPIRRGREAVAAGGGAGAAPVAPAASTLAGTPIAPATDGNHILTVINTTGTALTLFITDNTGRTHQQNLTAGTTIKSIAIPDISVSAYVQSRDICAPISIDNGLKGIIITPNTVGVANYIITPLIQHYEQYVFVYNNSPTQQLLLLEIVLPRAGIAGLLPTFIVGIDKLVLSKELNPQQCCLLEIPNVTHSVTSNTPTIVTPTAMHLNVPTSNTGPYPLNQGEYNSFIITAENNLVAST